ncbi:MAG: hypothetical protein M1557_01450 [Actinobacteria bacterium]|nr:hypothetical protein [Actinomycetota bacterium]
MPIDQSTCNGVCFVDQFHAFRVMPGHNAILRPRPATPQEWGELAFVCREEGLLPVIVDDGSIGDPVSEAVPSSSAIASWLTPMKVHGVGLYAVDFGAMLAPGVAENLVIIGERSVQLIQMGPQRRSTFWPGTSTLAPLTALVPSSRVHEGSLDGCLSVCDGDRRVVVGISAMTTPEVMLAAAVFDMAATIFACGGGVAYTVLGWCPQVTSIAQDLASLAGESVTVLDPIVVASGANRTEHVALAESQHQVGPRGSARLWRRTYSDWKSLQARLSS